VIDLVLYIQGQVLIFCSRANTNWLSSLNAFTSAAVFFPACESLPIYRSTYSCEWNLISLSIWTIIDFISFSW
jgi:hypothetical protein